MRAEALAATAGWVRYTERMFEFGAGHVGGSIETGQRFAFQRMIDLF